MNTASSRQFELFPADASICPWLQNQVDATNSSPGRGLFQHFLRYTLNKSSMAGGMMAAA